MPDSDRRTGHGAHAVDPAAMIIEHGAGHLVAQRARQLREIRASRPCAILTTISRGTGNSSATARCRAKARAAWRIPPWCRAAPRTMPVEAARATATAFATAGIEIAARRRNDLNGHLARNVRLPFAGSLAHQHHRAGGQRDKESHDRDDSDKRAAGDRIARHQRRLEARQQRAGGLRASAPSESWADRSSLSLNHKRAAARRAAPAGAHRTGPSARCRGWR